MNHWRGMKRSKWRSSCWLVSILCIACCCAHSGYFLVTEDADVENPQILVEKQIGDGDFDFDNRYTEEELYRLASEVLLANGWDVDTNLGAIRARLSCSGDPSLYTIEMFFADRYLDRLRPSLKLGFVYFDYQERTIHILIEYQALSWGYQMVNLAEIKIGLYEAVEIAREFEDEQFTKDIQNCVINAHIDGDEGAWIISYAKKDSAIRSGWKIKVDVESGEAAKVRWP